MMEPRPEAAEHRHPPTSAPTAARPGQDPKASDMPGGMTAGPGGAGGGLWTWGRCARCWRRTRRGFAARFTGRWSPRCPWARHGAGHTRVLR
jgi:hypothetical protein